MGWLAKQIEKADQDPAAREPDAPMRLEDLEEGEIPAQEEQSQSTLIAEAPDARGVRGASGVRAGEVLTEALPRDGDDVSLEVGDQDQEYERMATYVPMDAEDEDIALLQPIMNLVIEGVREGIMAHDVEILKLIRKL